MISIKFLDKTKKSLTVITSFFDVRISNKLAETSTAQFTIPHNQETIYKLKNNVRQVGNIVEVRANLNTWRNVFTWIIRKTTISWQYVKFDCIDLVSYHRSFAEKNKIFWSYRSYSPPYPKTGRTRRETCPHFVEWTWMVSCIPWRNYTTTTEYNANYKGQVNNAINYFHNLYWIDLFSIGDNNTTKYIETPFKEKPTSFFDFMNYLKQYHDVYWRSNWYNMDIIWDFDEILPWLWKYDYTDIIGSDVVGFKRIESLDSILQNNKTDNYPTIEIEDKERYKYKVWQKKAIQIYTQLDWGNTWYIGYITEINIKAEATKVVGTIKVEEEPRKRTDESLRGVLENLHKRVIET